MKEITLPTQINLFITDLLNSLAPQERPSSKPRMGKEPPRVKRNRLERKVFFYYMRLVDADTMEIAGHLADISSGGFMLDSQKPVPVNKKLRFLLNLSSEVADKPSMVFVARSRWCGVDPLDPYTYNVGYQLVQIAPEDLEIFNRMIEKYGREYDKRTVNLRRSNKW